MNQPTTYEITIAQKLEHITVPDMRDMIWDRIEAALDADDGTDPGDNGGVPTPSVPPAGIITGGVLLLIIAGWWFFSNQTSPPQQPPFPLQQQTEKTTAPPLPTVSPGTRPIDPALPAQQLPAAAPATTVPQQAIADSSNSIAATPLNKTFNDTAPAIAPPPVVNLQPVVQKDVKKDSVPPVKRRGVQGLTPNDYRVVPKKDSGQKVQ
ncbi:MAG TPA: hypothetical protein VLC98_00355 [Phnomibacter sp.]|nr:hypothetical protein [Phnomibacter sp.]